MPSDRKTNIAVTAEFLCHSHFTGVENYLYNLIHSIASLDRVNLTLICPSETPYKLIPENVTICKHDAFRLFGTRFISSLVNPPKNLGKFALIHCPTVVAPFFFSAEKNKKTKVVMTVHDLIPIIYPKFNIVRRRIYFKYLLKYRFRFVDHFIVPSQSVRNDLVNYFKIDPYRISVIYEGVSERYRPNNMEKQSYILAVSTLEPRKNFKRIIECYMKLRQDSRIDEKLIIVGKSGWYYKDILNIPEKLAESIIFKGYVPEEQLIELYQHAKFFVYPSLYEGFGLPVAEAMACGCPVITSNRSSLPEVGGDATWFVNPENKIELEQAMIELSHNKILRKNMIDKGLNQVKRFTWKRCAEETLALYEKVLTN